jgi:hypothetical protein
MRQEVLELKMGSQEWRCRELLIQRQLEKVKASPLHLSPTTWNDKRSDGKHADAATRSKASLGRTVHFVPLIAFCLMYKVHTCRATLINTASLRNTSRRESSCVSTHALNSSHDEYAEDTG